jgi:hypothetical protein
VNWRRTLFDNLGFKLAALTVVSMLWISVTADERQAQPVATRVVVEVRDTSWVLVDPPEEVSTTFQGRNRELLGLLMDKPVLVIEIDSVTGEVMRVPLQVDRVRYDRELGVIPSFVTPPAIDLRFERRGTARLPVTVDVQARPAAGFTVMMPMEVDPESVTVRGPASWLDSLTRVSTRHVSLEDLSNTVIRDIPIALPDGVEAARAEPPSVLVTISLDSLVVRRRRVPILLRGAAASAVRAEPDSVTVEVRGAAGPVAARLAALGGIIVTVTDIPSAPYAVALQVEAGQDGPAAVSLTPATATIRPAR